MDALRLDLPIRTSERKTEARSPQQQRDIAQACAATHRYTIAMVHDSGRSESGKTMDRATLHAIMDRVRSGLTDGVIVALTDRLGRAPIEEAMTWVRELNRIGGVLVPADAGGRPVDLADPQAETNLVLQLQMARQFWLTKAAGFKRSRRDAVAAGKFVGPTPLGYERVAGRLRPDPARADVMSGAYRAAAQDGVHAAIRHLQAHVPDREWDTSHVRRVLASRVYLGESRSGEFVNLAAHEPLTDLATWTRAQIDSRGRRASGDYPLTHHVHCGACGWGLTGQLQAARGRTYRRMRCSNPSCQRSSISADKLERHIREEMAERLAEGSPFRKLFAPEGMAEAEAALAAAKGERSALTSKVRPSHPDFSGWLEEADALVAQAESRFTLLASAADQYEELPLAHELDDPVKFMRALRAAVSVGTITIRPGRGAVADRAVYALDDVAGVLGA